MKRTLLITLSAAGIWGGTSTYAQSQAAPNTAPAILRARSQSVLERFDEDLVPNPGQRRKMKQQRLAVLRERRAIIDTLPVSERHRKKLLRELYNSPHKSLWDKTLTHLDFEEGVETADPD